MAAPIIAIRKAVIAALKAAHLECGDDEFQVFDTPVFGLEPDEVPCIQVTARKTSGARVALNSQVYDNTHSLVIRVIARAAGHSDTMEADIADALATADDEIQQLLLSTWRTWAPMAKNVEFVESDGLPKFEGDALMAKLDLVFNVVLEARRVTTPPTAPHTAHVEDSPKPKTDAGWEVTGAAE